MIRGHQTDVVAELFLVTGRFHFNLSREEIMAACWYEAQWGGQDMFQSRWRLWAKYISAELARGEIPVEQLPLPPVVLANEPGE